MKQLLSRWGKYEVSREFYNDILGGELFPLWVQHEKEAGLGYTLNPDFNIFLSDGYIFYILRAGGRLAGYISFYKLYHHHYNIQMAQQDLLYVAPEHRGKWVASKLLKIAEDDVIELFPDISALVQNSRTKNDISPFFIRNGYEKVDTIFYKRV